MLEQQQQVSRKPKAICEQILTAAASLFPTKLALKTSAYYAVSPFIGTALSLVIFRELPGLSFWAALVIMILGAWLASADSKSADAAAADPKSADGAAAYAPEKRR